MCHTGEESSQKPLVSGPLGAEHVARIQVKAQRAEGEEEGKFGQGRQQDKVVQCLTVLTSFVWAKETLQVA